MRFRELAAAALAAMVVAWATVPALAESSGYTIGPAGPADPRNNYVPQAGAVFVADNAKGQISIVSPTTRTTRSW
jgi:microcystin-dependent protein